MKRFLRLVAGGALTVSLVVGQSAWAMNMPLAADDSKSPAQKLQDAIDDMNSGSLFSNPLGYWSGNTYIYNSMGISLTIPESFSIMEGEIDNEGKYLVSAVDEATKEVFQLVEVNLIAAGAQDMTEEECLEEYKSGMVESGGLSVESEDISLAQLGGEDYTLLDMSVDMDGTFGNVASYCRIADDTAYIFTAINFDAGHDGVTAILDSVAPLEFGVWNGSTYTNPYLGISVDIPEDFSVETDSTLYEDGSAFPLIAQNSSTGEAFQVAFVDLEMMEGGEVYSDDDIEEVMDAIFEGMATSAGVDLDSPQISDTTLAGEEFTLMASQGDVGQGQTMEINCYGRIVDRQVYVLVATGLAGSTTGIDSMINEAIPAYAGVFNGYTYANVPLQMSMDMPESWMVAKEYTAGDDFDEAFMVGDAQSGESIQLQVYDLEDLGEEDLTEEEYSELLASQFESMGNYEVVSTDDTVLIGGIPYSGVTVRTELSGTAMEQKLVFRILDDYLYVFYFTAEEGNYSDGYNSVLESMGM